MMPYRKRRPFAREGDWSIERNFVKIPISLLHSDKLSSNAKVAWAVMYTFMTAFENRKGKDNPHKNAFNSSFLQCYLGVSKRTCSRIIEELISLDLIKDTKDFTYMKDPVEVIQKIEEEEAALKRESELQLMKYLEKAEEVKNEIQEAEESKLSREEMLRNDLDCLKMAWNDYKPDSYAKLHRPNEALLYCINTHMRQNGYEKREYQSFFRDLSTGIRASNFWAHDNANKNLMSIVGTSRKPTDLKSGHVLNILEACHRGLDETDQEVSVEPVKSVVSKKLRHTVNRYHELHNIIREDKVYRQTTSEEIIMEIKELEESFRVKGYDPSWFRRESDLEWPTSVQVCEIDWIYDDSKELV